MDGSEARHFVRLPLEDFQEQVEADPQVPCTEAEIKVVLEDLMVAVDEQSYIPATPTADNPDLSEAYIFDTDDVNLLLKDLRVENFVGKVLDVGKGAIKRKNRGFPQEYLYVFQYPCRLYRRDAQESGVLTEDILIYVKINNRKIPYKKVFIVSFHKNRPRVN